MTVSRAFLLAAMVAAIPLHHAAAQFGGMPGMPGSGGPGMPGGGMPGGGGGFGAPSAPPPACQNLLTLRDETQKTAGAINAAGERKATPVEACKLFKTFLAAESKMIKAVKDSGPQCGLPPDVAKNLEAGHSKAQQIANQVCEAAARGPVGPSLSDALGVSPTLPSGKTGFGTFDTLTGK